jgi:HEAT repeat protein
LSAVSALGRFPGEISEAALFRALDDDSFFVARVATLALARLNPDREPEPVVRALRRRIARDSNSFLKRIAQSDEPEYKEPDAVEIAELGLWRFTRVDALNELVRGLDDGILSSDEPLMFVAQRHALEALGRIGDRRAVDIVAKQLGDAKVGVRVAAVHALAEIGGTEVVTQHLRRALRDRNGSVRRAAIRGLAAVGGDEANLALLAARRQGPLRDRLTAVRSLRRARRRGHAFR